jgi:PAS domain S-box-containing protein
MTYGLSESKKNVTAIAGFFILMILAVFITELAVMQLLAPVFSTLHPFFASLLDASILVLLYALPLSVFGIRQLSGTASSGGGSLPQIIPTPLFVRVLTIIFLIEFLVMSALPSILPRADDDTRSIVDALLTILFSVFPLWWLLFRGKWRIQTGALIDLLEAPLRLFGMLLFMFFLIDLLLEQYFPLFFPHISKTSYKFVDSFLSTLCVAPVLWFFVVWPLKRTSISESARIKSICDQVHDAIMSIDRHGIVKLINPAAGLIFGYRLDEITGKTAALLLHDGPQCLENLLVDVAAGDDNSNSNLHLEVNGKHRDGSILILDVSISKVILGGEEEFLLVMRNITDRKKLEHAIQESEQRFRQIFNKTEDAIIFFRPGTSTIVDVNATAESLFGLTRMELQNGGVARLVRHADVAQVNRAIRSVRPGKMIHLENICSTRNDGTEIVLSMRGKIMTLNDEDLVYCTFRDITERVRMEQKAQEIKAKLIQANKMTSLGLMVSGVAHEINNPNNFILANSQLMAKIWEDAREILREYHQEHGEFSVGGIPFKEVDSHLPQLLAGINEGTKRIRDIVHNLKSFARQGQNAVEHDVNINRVATLAVSILHHEISKFTHEFHLDLEENIPVIRGNSQQLGQVITNLLMNACQALPDKRCSIWLETRYDAATGQVKITVRDEGSGMSREDCVRIMEPFFTTKLDKGGTGLGLFISQSIIKEHGGSLEFTSEPGKGTTFVVGIPTGRSVSRGHST